MIYEKPDSNSYFIKMSREIIIITGETFWANRRQEHFTIFFSAFSPELLNRFQKNMRTVASLERSPIFSGYASTPVQEDLKE